jgi:hypothetical protein
MAAPPTAAAQGIYGTALLKTGGRKAISHLVYMLKIIPYLRHFEHAFQKIVTDYNFITAITVLFFPAAAATPMRQCLYTKSPGYIPG